MVVAGAAAVAVDVAHVVGDAAEVAAAAGQEVAQLEEGQEGQAVQLAVVAAVAEQARGQECAGERVGTHVEGHVEEHVEEHAGDHAGEHGPEHAEEDVGGHGPGDESPERGVCFFSKSARVPEPEVAAGAAELALVAGHGPLATAPAGQHGVARAAGAAGAGVAVAAVAVAAQAAVAVGDTLDNPQAGRAESCRLAAAAEQRRGYTNRNG